MDLAIPAPDGDRTGETGTPECVTIRVRNESYAPVKRAEIFHGSCGARLLSRENLRSISFTDDDGSARVVRSILTRCMALGCVAVRQDGYLVSTISSLSDSDTIDVTLLRGEDLHLRCIGLDDAPIPGVLVAASLRSLGDPLGEVTTDIPEAGLDPSSSIFVARTGLQGEARLRGLPSGVHELSVSHPGFDLMDRRPRANVPGPPLTVRMAPIVCGRVEVVEDRVLSFNAEPGDAFIPEWLSRHEVRRLRLEHEAAFPDALIFLGLDSSNGAKPIEVLVDVWLQKTGIRRLTLRLGRHSETCEALIIDHTAVPSEVAATATLFVAIVDHAGSPIPVPGIRARSMSARQFFFPLVHGAEIALPVGSYELVSVSSQVGQVLPRQGFSVHRWQDELRIVLAERLYACRFALLDARTREPIPNGMVRFTTHGITATQKGLDLAGLDNWLPAGTFQCTAMAPGYLDSESSQEVVEGCGTAQVIEILMDRR